MRERRPACPPGAAIADHLLATAVTVAAFAVAFITDCHLLIANLSLLLLTAVLAFAVRKRMAAAVYTAAPCFIGDNSFFTQPRQTPSIANGDDVLGMGLFLTVALVCSRMATQLSSQVTSLRAAQLRARTLV